MKQTVIFTKETIPFILEALNFKINKDNGLVLDKDNNIMGDVDGYEFKPEDIIGIFKGEFLTMESQIHRLKFWQWEPNNW